MTSYLWEGHGSPPKMYGRSLEGKILDMAGTLQIWKPPMLLPFSMANGMLLYMVGRLMEGWLGAV